MIDIPTLITKLRNAPRKVGTFGRGDPKPLDEFAPLITGEEREWLATMAERQLSGRVDCHMQRARRLVESHIDAYGMVPHPDKIKEAIAEQSQESFDLGFRAAGGEIERLKRTSGEG